MYLQVRPVMHLDATARATSPVEDQLGRKFASSFRADEVERNWVEARCCGETGADTVSTRGRQTMLRSLTIPRPGRARKAILGDLRNLFHLNVRSDDRTVVSRVYRWAKNGDKRRCVYTYVQHLHKLIGIIRVARCILTHAIILTFCQRLAKSFPNNNVNTKIFNQWIRRYFTYLEIYFFP